MMEYEEGGLSEQGGSVDPVSGNEVPPGALQEEVRDDIDAKLSEGEFVFPADVVRYIGLEKLMKMRQQAKQGLAMMEEMGQMSNADEATVEDTVSPVSSICQMIWMSLLLWLLNWRWQRVAMFKVSVDTSHFESLWVQRVTRLRSLLM